ncbi:MAG: glycosyltransferase [Chloroflexi bacterium]|nr:glycosyltransferase [Chloroflexota bacterium]
MFPRRIVEMPMANIFVISDNCSALTALFPEIPQSASPKRTKELLTYYLRCERERTEIIEELRKKIMEDYTYQKQQARISDMAQSLRR